MMKAWSAQSTVTTAVMVLMLAARIEPCRTTPPIDGSTGPTASATGDDLSLLLFSPEDSFGRFAFNNPHLREVILSKRKLHPIPALVPPAFPIRRLLTLRGSRFGSEPRGKKHLSLEAKSSGKKLPLGLGVLSDVQDFFQDLRSELGVGPPAMEYRELAPRPGEVYAFHDLLSSPAALRGYAGLHPRNDDAPFSKGVSRADFEGDGRTKEGVADHWPAEPRSSTQRFVHSGIGR